MNFLAITAIAHALGWTLLHFCWQGTLIAVFLACALSLLHGRSSQARYLVACAALFLMAVLPLLTCIHLALASQIQPATLFTSPLQTPPINIHGAVSFSQPLWGRITTSLDRSMPLLLALWSAGVLFLFVRLCLGLAIANRMKSTAAHPLPASLQTTFDQLAASLSITRPIRLLHSAIVQVPTLIGWFRPVVLIPLGCLTGFSSEQVEAILLHELAHIRRHDYLVNVLQSVVEALLFYHPAVWWVSKTIRKEREHCCDDLAVKIGGNTLVYARALSLLEEHRSLTPALTLGITGGNLTMRIKRLLGLKTSPALSPSAALVILAMILSAAAFSITAIARAQSFHNQPLIPSNEPRVAALNPASTAPTLSTEYQNWLDQDARWIITPAERTAFLALPTDPERNHFIEQFWLRRDPAGSSPNTFRMEHYRRLAYANQHFAANVPGWQTDRGRIYILYGQPLTIDIHPVSDSPGPYEVWKYQDAPELGHKVELKFIDLCKCGNYQLQQSASIVPETANPDQALYAKGLDDIRQHRFETARLALQTLINTYPSSPLVTPAQLAIASSWDQQGGPEAALEANRSYQEANVLPSKIGDGVIAPVLTHDVNPEYPQSARQAKVQGKVLLNLWIDEQGTTSHVRVVRGIAKELDEKAIQAVQQYRFNPATKSGKPLLVAVNVEVNFQMF